MSEEHFDDQIRKKLNQVQPAYAPEAWKRLQKQLPLPWYHTLWTSVGAAQVALLLSLGSLFYTWWQGQQWRLENQALRQKLQDQVARVDTVLVVQRDTVYSIQRVVVAAPPVERWVETPSAALTSFPEKEKTKPSESEVVAEIQPTEEPRTAPEVAQEVKEIEKEVEEKAPEATPAEVAQSATKSPKKEFHWPLVHARVGIASDYVGLKFPTLGPQLDVFLGKNLSLQTGVLFSAQQTINHARPIDFNLLNGVNFEDKYLEQIKNIAPRRIQNIAITTSFVQIPILLKYQVTTPTAWSFHFLAGTKLDHRVFQEVTFLDGVLGDIQRRRFEAQQKPKSFHSLTYGMGVQYQRGRWVGQITPYFDFPFRSNINGPNIPRRFGIQSVFFWDFYPEKRRRLQVWD